MDLKSGYTFLFSGCIFLALLMSCEDLVEVDDPRSQLVRTVVFEDDITAEAAVLQLYAGMTLSNFSNVIYPASCSADELVLEGGLGSNEQVPFYQNELTAIDPVVQRTWLYHYNSIYTANSIIEGLEKATKVTRSLKAQLMGEAFFFRAYQHFHLVNLFNDVPYVMTTDYEINSTISRMPVVEVYQHIVADLLEAKELLTNNYSYSKNERVRVNKWVATAMLARVYLYQQDWLHAEEQATSIINNNLFALNTDLDEVFLKNSKETIWQLIPPYPRTYYTPEGAALNYRYYVLERPKIPEGLFNAFETNDDRKTKWISVGTAGPKTWYYPVKYKEAPGDTIGPNEYSTILRLAEQYLIRSEARAMQYKLTGVGSAASDLNVIRGRAGLLPTTATTLEGLLMAIEQERRVELFTEGAHRWFDLKRTGRASTVLSVAKPLWSDTDVLYPIPETERLSNTRLTQNFGY